MMKRERVRLTQIVNTNDHSAKHGDWTAKKARGRAGIGELRINSTLVFIILFSAMPLVDSLNGMLIRANGSNAIGIGDVYRFFVLLASFAFFAKKIRKGFFVAFLSSAAFSLLAISVHALIGLGGGAFSEFNLVVQWLFAPILTLSLYTAIRNNVIRANAVISVLNILKWLAPLTILVPYFLNVGYSTYGASDGSFVGYKAFYYANNGISLMLIALFAWTAYLVFQKKTPSNFFTLLLNGCALALIGTKSSLLMLILSFFIVIYSLYGDRLLKLLGKGIMVIIVAAVLLFAFSSAIYDFLFPILDRWAFFSTKVYGDDILSALTSGRVDLLPVYWEIMLSAKNSFLAIVFGMGDLSRIIKLCEIDYADMFFQFGLIGLLLLLSFIFYVVKKGRSSGRKRSFALSIVIFLLVYALIVGHVFNNAMSSMVFVLFAVYAMTESEHRGA